MMAGPGPEPQYQGANPAIHPAKTPGDMTADEAQKAHAAGQAEAQRTGTAQPGTQPTPQQAKVDESKGKVDMSKTVSPSTKK
jgi:hypothetical protein